MTFKKNDEKTTRALKSILSIVLFLLLFVVSCSTPTPKDKEESSVILAVFAHPDDETTAGPALARFAEEGHDVFLAYTTDGRFGVTDHSGIPAGDSLVAIRKKEAECSCKALKINEPIFLGGQDGMGLNGQGSFYEQEAIIKPRIQSLLAELQPDRIITFGPEGDTGHPDHRMTGLFVTQVLLEGDLPETSELWYFGWTEEQSKKYDWWDINFVNKKYLTIQIPFGPENENAANESINCHKSQYTQTEMDRWITAELNDETNVLHFRPLLLSNKP